MWRIHMSMGQKPSGGLPTEEKRKRGKDEKRKRGKDEKDMHCRVLAHGRVQEVKEVIGSTRTGKMSRLSLGMACVAMSEIIVLIDYQVVRNEWKCVQKLQMVIGNDKMH